MHLQSLELFGFKSFADKTVFHFHEGITAIVGPNGCGKSNLLDAVRWVLGEQSAKSLRGGEMADVIFNGAETRKPLGFAEVSLTLTNCGAELGVDWHDVRVTRRIYRDGNSEYFLNKTGCRLRDIQNLFADTGVARSAYSMMEQGKIDLILSSRPEDRRAIFEEAAGITKYKTQKREALRKLEATEANLLRIGDIIKEVKRQIGSLQRQAGKARRYQSLLADLQVLDTHHSRRKLDKLESDLRQCRAEIESITAKERAARDQIEQHENALAETRRSLEQTDGEIADARTEIERLQSEIAGHQGRIELNRQRAEEITELIARARNEIGAAEAKHDRHQTEMEQMTALLEQTLGALETKRKELADLAEAGAKLRSERTQRESELQGLLLNISKSQNRIASLGGELTSLVGRRDLTNEHLRELDREISNARLAHGKAEAAVTAGRKDMEAEKNKAEALLGQMEAGEEKLHRHREVLAELETRLTNLERTLAEKESRLEVLKQLNEEGEGLAQGSQAVLKGLDNPGEIRSALAGALVAQLDVADKYVAAIEAILGRNLHAIVLRKPELAPKIIAHVTEKKLGQAALFVSELNPASLPPRQTSLPNGALAWATSVVTAPAELAPLINQLLPEIAIFADLTGAIACKKASPGLAVATLAGEFISREGIIFGGSASSQSESLLARKGRISVLGEQRAALELERTRLFQERDAAKAGLEKAVSDVDAAREAHRAAGLAHSTSETKAALLQRELEDAIRSLDNLTSEKSTLQQQLAAAQERIDQLEKEMSAARRVLAESEERQKALETARAEGLVREEKTAEQLNDLRLAVATEQQRHDGLVEQRQPMTSRESELAETIATRRTEIEKFENRLVLQAEESKAAEAAIQKQNVRREEIKAAASSLAEERANHSASLSEAESELRDARNSLNDLHDERASHQVHESQLQMKIENLTEHVQRRYHVDLRNFAVNEMVFEKTLRVQLKRRGETAAGDPGSAPASGAVAGALREEADRQKDLDGGAEIDRRGSTPAPEPDLEKLIAGLTQQLDNMGPVNLDAVQEYDELEERHRFLDTQNTDLTTSRRELLDVIARINSTTQKLFAETFAQVRVNFREMFAELFGGGRADLSLMDEGDPLNCGIEISAKPPGKQLQAISLLSGGERTMTAVALLFAIYMVRPSPFCVLDELDAALDETNINRFVQVLDRFVEQSQFIIITHNKRTIAKADILYGVTMEERGVSKLIGMKLADRPGASREADPERGAETPTQRQFALVENGHGEKHRFAAR